MKKHKHAYDLYTGLCDYCGKQFRMKLNTIIQGDCLEVMKGFDTGIVDLVVTSPPYDSLREYKGYVFNFEGIAKELYRVIKDGGVVVWVVGDATISGSETGTSFKQALYFKEIGFNLHDTMIWNKLSQATHDPRNKRYKQEFEYMLILTKSKPKTYNEICDRKTLNGGKIIKKPTKRKVDGSTRKHPNVLIKEFQARSNIWSIHPERKSKHPAPFPEKLANDHILSWSNKDDLVLDPMCGSGTTCKMAKLLSRNYIGIEISPEYVKIANKRLAQQILL